MKKMRSLFIVLCFFLLGTPFVYAQDVLWTQFARYMVWQNPAHMPNDQVDAEVSSITRNQYASVPVGYTSSALCGRLVQTLGTGKSWSPGLLVVGDRAGDLGYGHQGLWLPLAVQWMNPQGDAISIGLSPAFQFLGWNARSLRTADQFSGDAFQLGVPSADASLGNNVRYGSLNMGLHSRVHLGYRSWLEVGFSRTGFSGDFSGNNPGFSLSSRLVANALHRFRLMPSLDLEQVLLLARQGSARQFVLQSGFRYRLSAYEAGGLQLLGAISWRTADALAFQVGAERGPWSLGLSFDATTSRFRTATQSNGAIEILISYRWFRAPIVPLNRKACPTFL
jgi:hypothetical protein